MVEEPSYSTRYVFQMYLLRPDWREREGPVTRIQRSDWLVRVVADFKTAFSEFRSLNHIVLLIPYRARGRLFNILTVFSADCSDSIF